MLSQVVATEMLSGSTWLSGGEYLRVRGGVGERAHLMPRPHPRVAPQEATPACPPHSGPAVRTP